MISWKTDKTITDIRIRNFKGKKYRYGLHNGYPVKEIKGRWYLRHLLVARLKYELDEMPKGFHVHHIDGVKEHFNEDNLIIIHKKDHRVIHKLMKNLSSFKE